ncbi:diacylglycerol O-acyltransferase 1 [Condylostylus longicornis]|uniref:diacylglycerol O-acyltransferase 1 n=1 Tax=Condylostylus longicornis TaxID=2530218 RepID=UPI00244E39ED|nr:diacylglycerol O-acyltransferase 1 [Condylostylus longicornis]XP_055376425.1 diacylglycerol O-acyltransferase 1 [Condylostylus longicornis]XP_055376426.1 diacylglycerol O-acyltransferase 1 [Condylostylus longicornis]XP_055376427.1 diacylglycerol O-acyltransferase 1 [Condylostylus longicornis]
MATDQEESKLRFRRTQSVTRAEEITTKEQKQRKSQPDKPCHKPRDSLFSWSSGFDNWTGLVNWGFLLLTMGGFRLCLENLLKYGVRIDPIQWYIVLSGKNEGEGHPSLILVVYSLVPITICLLLEKGLSLEIIGESAGMFAQVVNIIVLVLIPMVVIHVREYSFSLVGATTVCFLYSILFMKMWSYVQVNMWSRQALRDERCSTKKRRPSVSIAELQNAHNTESHNHHEEDNSNITELVHYPDNLNFKDLFYFLCAPTLCYELNFPRTTRVRKRFLIKRLLEVVIGVNVVMALFQQWMIPSVKNSLVPFSNMDVMKATERLLKLAIPNHLVWLCFFYLMFHSFLNLCGELLHFADRNFYNDWWNANNIDTFWRTWNMPVHRWCVRHLYIPVVEMGYSSRQASIIVFFISAFFHEYLVSVPLNTFKIWAFMGMMGQIPLSAISKFMQKNFGPRWGNIVVWASIILGQPLCIMMYYHDYVVTHFSGVLSADNTTSTES